ncbi:MAG TPA: ribosome maturation factor RimM [Caulobacteraceae bacterium]
MATPDRLILVGKVAGAFGLKGELRLIAYTADSLALVAYGPLRHADGSTALTPQGGRAVKGAVIARASEVATREAAEALRGLELHILRSALPQPGAEEFYLADLIGLKAVSPQGAHLGKVRSVADFGAGDLLEIEPPGGAPSWWAPFTLAATPEVRVDEGLVVVEPQAREIGRPAGPTPDESRSVRRRTTSPKLGR